MSNQESVFIMTHFSRRNGKRDVPWGKRIGKFKMFITIFIGNWKFEVSFKKKIKKSIFLCKTI